MHDPIFFTRDPAEQRRLFGYVSYHKGGGGSAPAPVPPPPPPTVEDADVKAEEDAKRNALRRGRASTVLSDQSSATAGGSAASPTTMIKQLLGS